MKIISGILKGRKIDGYDTPGTRPTMDRVKESLFAMIQNEIKDAVVLDLFAGSGSLGLEAISNGAKKVYFIDHNKKCIDNINKHIKLFNVSNYSETLCVDYKDALNIFKNENIKFNLIFLDPPYSNSDMPDIIKYIINNDLLDKKAKIICELTNRDLIKEYEQLDIIKEKRYSDKYIVIYNRKGEYYG